MRARETVIGQIDAKLKARNYIPVTSWLLGIEAYQFIEREMLRLKKDGFDILVKTHIYKRCLYRKLLDVEINNIALHGTLFDPTVARTRSRNIGVYHKREV